MNGAVAPRGERGGSGLALPCHPGHHVATALRVAPGGEDHDMGLAGALPRHAIEITAETELGVVGVRRQYQYLIHSDLPIRG